MDVGRAHLQDAYHSRRSLQKGRISINGALAKAARTVKPGDVIQVRKPPRHLFLQSSATHRKACRRKVSGRNDGECNDSGTV